MKRLSMVTLILLFLLSSCVFVINPEEDIEGSDEIVSKNIPTGSGFIDTFAIDSVSTVTITKGNYYSVNVKINKNIENHMNIFEQSGVLHIGLSDEYDYSDITFEVNVVTPDISSVDVDGVSSCLLQGFDLSHNLYLDVDGVSSINAYNSSLDGALNLAIDGTSAAHLEGLVVTGNAYVEISGVSSVWIDVSDIIAGYIEGVSSLFYRNGTLSGDFDKNDFTCTVGTF